MRSVSPIIAGAILCLSSPASAAYEFYVTVKGVARDARSGPIYLLVETSRDIGGDGAADDGILRIVCAAGKLRSASFHYNVKGLRDAASAQASGKRPHQPTGFVKEWRPSTPQFRSIRPLATAKGDKLSGDAGGWAPISLSNADGLCPAAEAAAGTATKSRSNIQNN
jgi:hypothetical protein